MNKLAQFISVATHPVFSVFIAVCIFCFLPSEAILHNENSLYHLDGEIKRSLLIFYGVFTIAFPLVSLFSLYTTKSISSLQIPDRRERFLPVFFVIIIYGTFYYFLKKAYYPTVLLSSCIGVISGFIIFLLLNFKFKVSLHGMGIGLLLGLLISYYNLQGEFSLIPIGITAFLVGIIGWARIRLEAHSNTEYFIGTAIGLFTQIICIKFEFYL